MTIPQVDDTVILDERSVPARHRPGQPHITLSGHAVALLRDLLVVALVAIAILLLLPAALAAQAAVSV